jgi:hypothetical protein
MSICCSHCCFLFPFLLYSRIASGRRALPPSFAFTCCKAIVMYSMFIITSNMARIQWFSISLIHGRYGDCPQLLINPIARHLLTIMFKWGRMMEIQ